MKKEKIKIRKANKEDERGIINIFKKRENLNQKDKENKKLKKYIKEKKKKKTFLVLVAEIDKKIVGVVICNISRISKTNADLVDIYVLNEYRNKGIGSELMYSLYMELKNRGIENLGLYSENNPKTLNFYKNQGFEIGRLIRRCDKKIK